MDAGVVRIMLRVLVLGVFFCASAQAEELSGRRLTFGGFGSLAANYHDTGGLEYRRSAGQPDGIKANQVDFADDSLAGLQVNAAWNQQLEAVAQAVSKHSADHDWRPRLTRAFVRYVPDESIMLRVGRIGYEFFPRADSSDIGYTYLTLRPPTEMFGQLPNDDFDGADLTLTYPLGPGLARAKLFGGRTSGLLAQSDGSTVDLAGSKVWGGLAEYLQGPWAARLGVGWYLVGHPPSMDQLSAGLRQTGQAQAQNLANEFDQKGRRTVILTAALTYDDGPWQGRLYLARTDTQSPIGPKLNIGSASLGYGIGKFTPYALLSRAHNYADVQSTGLPDSPQTAALNAGVYQAQTQSQTNQSTAAAGVRYDFAPKMDLKFQVGHVWEHGSQLVFDRNMPPRDNAELTLFGLSFDFVF
jgi:hypothetical protein